MSIVIAASYSSLASAIDVLATDQAIMSAGHTLYDRHCARCHGADATGGIGQSAKETVKAPSLVGLAKKNGGVMPLWQMYEFINGSKLPPDHRNRAMPIWGEDFARMRGVNPEQKEAIVRGRILAILAYLASIQEK